MVARTLALRGWQVTVLEQQAQAGAGASGLPAGLVSAIGDSPADPLYGITRSAYHLTRQILQSMLVQGEDWDEGGAMRAFAPGAWRAEALWLNHLADCPLKITLGPSNSGASGATPGVTFTVADGKPTAVLPETLVIARTRKYFGVPIVRSLAMVTDRAVEVFVALRFVV
jgi:hypothetical protein